MLPTGTVKDVTLAGGVTDQMALVEYGTPAEAANALNLNGMKIGDAHTLQVRSCCCCMVQAGARNTP
jgi:hypothetical protein